MGRCALLNCGVLRVINRDLCKKAFYISESITYHWRFILFKKVIITHILFCFCYGSAVSILSRDTEANNINTFLRSLEQR